MFAEIWMPSLVFEYDIFLVYMLSIFYPKTFLVDDKQTTFLLG